MVSTPGHDVSRPSSWDHGRPGHDVRNRTREPCLSENAPHERDDPPRDRAQDRRVRRTRKALRDALIGLLVERPWDEIAVQDVCERADVGRSTFYTHFADREELLLSGFEELRTSLRAAPVEPRPLGFVPGLVAHVDENRKLSRALVGRRSGQIVHKRIHRLIVDLVAEDLSSVGRPGLLRDAAVQVLAGGLFDLLQSWLDAARPVPADELVAVYDRLARPILDEVARG